MGVSPGAWGSSIWGWRPKTFADPPHFYFLGFGLDSAVCRGHHLSPDLYPLYPCCSFGRWQQSELLGLSEQLAQEGVENGLKKLD